jgi:hypothetical protein
VSSSEPASRSAWWTDPRVWLVLTGVGLLGWLLSFAFIEPARVWRALLINFLFFTGLSAGLVMWSAAIVLSRGNWAGRLENGALLGVAFALPSLITLAVLWAGSVSWAPWVGNPDVPWKAWLSSPRVVGRDMAGLVTFWILAAWYVRRRRVTRPRVVAAWLVLAYIVVFSLLGFDLVMGLALRWASALFGGYFLVSGLYMAACAWALGGAWTNADSERLHDLGRLIFAFCLLTTYFMYAQLVTIWYANLPDEAGFLVPRMNLSPGKWISWVLLAMVYAGPIILLLPAWVKRTRWALGAVALFVLAGMWIERWWLIQPTFGEGQIHFGLPEVWALVLMGGALGVAVSLYAPTQPAVLPEEAGTG